MSEELSSVNRCSKCGGLLWGQPQHTADFWCNCPPEPKSNLIGWECPRCHKIHSPFSIECDCVPLTTTSATTDMYCYNCINQLFNETMGCKNYLIDFKCKNYKENEQ